MAKVVHLASVESEEHPRSENERGRTSSNRKTVERDAESVSLTPDYFGSSLRSSPGCAVFLKTGGLVAPPHPTRGLVAIGASRHVPAPSEVLVLCLRASTPLPVGSAERRLSARSPAAKLPVLPLCSASALCLCRGSWGGAPGVNRGRRRSVSLTRCTWWRGLRSRWSCRSPSRSPSGQGRRCRLRIDMRRSLRTSWSARRGSRPCNRRACR